jgi:hypothetical protein
LPAKRQIRRSNQRGVRSTARRSASFTRQSSTEGEGADPPPPVEGDGLATEALDFLMTEAGDYLIPEP